MCGFTCVFSEQKMCFVSLLVTLVFFSQDVTRAFVIGYPTEENRNPRSNSRLERESSLSTMTRTLSAIITLLEKEM